MDMSYCFNGEWNEKTKGAVDKWLRDKLLSIQNEPPDDLFVEYIMIMIGNRKSLEEMSKELKDFFGEDEARHFSQELGDHLKTLKKVEGSGKQMVKSVVASVKSTTPVASKVVVSDESANTINANRSKQRVNSHNNSRLLQNAIRSSTVPIENVEVNDPPQPVVGKRKINAESTNASVNTKLTKLDTNDLLHGELRSKRMSVDEMLSQPLSSQRFTSKDETHSDALPNKRFGNSKQRNVKNDKPSSNKRVKSGSASQFNDDPLSKLFDAQTLDMMKNMSKVCGFSSVEEMIKVQQQSFLQTLTAGASTSLNSSSSNSQPQKKFRAVNLNAGNDVPHQPAEPSNFTKSQQYRKPTKRTDGQHENVPTQKTNISEEIESLATALEPYETDVTTNNTDTNSTNYGNYRGRGRGSRGSFRGRGRGSWGNTYVAPTYTPIVNNQIDINSPFNVTNDPFNMNAYSTRGRGRGRGGFLRGRGASVVQNNKWVRETTIEESLVAGR